MTTSTIATFSSRLSRNLATRYAAAFFVTAAALLARRALNPLLGDYVPYITLFPAVAFSAWYCGIGPSILSILLSVIGAQYWLVPPVDSLRILNTAQSVGILLFLLVSLLIVGMGEVNRRNTEAFRRAQGALEQRVQQRTVDLDAANESLRELFARLLQLQDDERRRIARELHDSVGQLLTGLAMNLSVMRTDIERLIKTAGSITDSEGLVQEMSREIRTISHLLHPPLLDEVGLSSALPWYIDGFSKRSNIKVDLDFPADFGRLSHELETAIFRVVQECLTNIHRHSESPTARIRIKRSATEVRVLVEDRGKGISAEKQSEMATDGKPGVGIRGMRERIRQLGGTLEIESNSKGTAVIAYLPLANVSALSAVDAA